MTTPLPPTESGLHRTMRRYGPLIGIVVVIVVVAAAVTRMSSPTTTTTAAGAGSSGAVSSTGSAAGAGDAMSPVSWQQAKDQGLNVTFGPGCDQDPNSKQVGRIAVPTAFAPPCFAQRASNGGATSPGVTGDSIKVVLFEPAPDPLIDQILAAIGANDAPEDVMTTYNGFVEIFQKQYETYGRKVELIPFKGTGTASDEIAARADAATIADTIKPFAVFGAPFLAPGFSDELAKRKIINFVLASSNSTTYFAERSPYLYNILAAPDQLSSVVAEYLSKRVKGRPAQFAGDPALQSQTRKFGLIYLSIPGANADELREKFNQQLKDAEVDIPVQVGSVDPTASAAQQIARMKQEGVTTVLFAGDPLSPKNFTAEATRQGYFPEWIVTGTSLVDSNTFARTYDPEQWKHAFGISQLFVRGKPEANWAYHLYDWYFGQPPPAKNATQVIFPFPSIFFSGIMAAGPNLTPQTFRQGLASLPTGGGVTVPQISYLEKGIWPDPDYSGIDDAVEVWWDPDATGPDERGFDGKGMYRYVDGGKRYLPGKWPTDDAKAFKTDGSVTYYQTVPESDQPADYPPPKR